MNDLDTFQSQDFSSDYRLRALFSMVPAGQRLLDVGSGNGAVVDLRAGGAETFTLVDISPTLVARLSERFAGHDEVVVCEGDACALNLPDTFDVITACDILEHIPDDAAAAASLAGALTPDGRLFVSVPALPFLYGARDRKYGHVRRYTKKTLRALLEGAGLEVERIRYWNALGVLPYFISERILRRPLVGPARTGAKGGLARLVNRLLYVWLRLEARVPLPFGLSLIVVCKRKA